MAKALATVPALTAHREDNYFRIGGCRCGPSKVGRRVRIRLPPAASLQTLGPSPQQGAGPRLADELEALGSRLRAHRGAGIHDACIPRDWRYAERWPPPGSRPRRLYLRGDGTLGADGPGGPPFLVPSTGSVISILHAR